MDSSSHISVKLIPAVWRHRPRPASSVLMNAWSILCRALTMVFWAAFSTKPTISRGLAAGSTRRAGIVIQLRFLSTLTSLMKDAGTISTSPISSLPPSSDIKSASDMEASSSFFSSSSASPYPSAWVLVSVTPSSSPA